MEFFTGFSGQLSDTAEIVQISAIALLKMLRHGRAGVPMEVMGLMLGEFVDEYTVRVLDVFAMPQSGTGVSVEAVDPVFQTQMMELLAKVGCHSIVVGWYHSHPGFGPWLSGVDINTQQSFEQLGKRSVAVVIDPIQSVKGNVVIDAFRLVAGPGGLNGGENRLTTSNVGHLERPNIVALIHGLNRLYYSLKIEYTKSDKESEMLLRMRRPSSGTVLALDPEFNVRSRERFSDLTTTLEQLRLSSRGLKAFKKQTSTEILDKLRVLNEENTDVKSVSNLTIKNALSSNRMLDSQFITCCAKVLSETRTLIDSTLEECLKSTALAYCL